MKEQASDIGIALAPALHPKLSEVAVNYGESSR